MYFPDSSTRRRDAARDFIRTSPVTTLLLAANIAFFLLLELTGGSQDAPNLYRWGAKFGPAVQDGDYYRLIVPIFLHAGVFHLLLNSFALFIFGPRLEQIFGSTAFVATYFVAGIFGVAASYWYSPLLSVGASGAIFGLVGAYAVYLRSNRELLGEEARQLLVSLAVIIGINIVFGFFFPGVDQAAHVGGLISGAAIAYFVAPKREIVSTETSLFGFGYARVRTRKRNIGRIALATAVALAATVGVVMYVSATVEFDAFAIQQYRVFELLTQN